MTIQDSKPGGDYAIVQLRTRVKEAISKTDIKIKIILKTMSSISYFPFPPYSSSPPIQCLSGYRKPVILCN